MTELAVTAGRAFVDNANWRSNPYAWRFWVFVVVLALLSVPGEIGSITAGALSEAYLQVTVFVGATLALVYLAENALGVDMGRMLQKSARWQPFVAALLGASPGCGGAIIVVTQYTRGYATFGSVVSVLTATMGDAAFLLIASEPGTAAVVIVVSILIGTMSGMIVDLIHGRDFLRPEIDDTPTSERPAVRETTVLRLFGQGIRRAWILLFFPGLVLGVLGALQIDADAFLAPLIGEGITQGIGVAGALVALSMWAFARSVNSHIVDDPHQTPGGSIWTRIIADTNFVTGWVVMAFLSFGVVVHVLGVDLGALFHSWIFLMPAIGVLVGLIPGCGPQIVVTTLYLTGAIPFSAQLANAISNDGDALFPAIALAPRAAMLASIYTSIPALAAGYGAMVFFGL